MPKIFNKIGSAIASETLGEVEELKKNNKPTPHSNKMLQQPTKKHTPMKTAKKEVSAQSIIATSEIDVTKKSGRYPALKYLNIDFEPELGVLLTPKDVENVEFSITAPTGLNADEIEQFCDTVQKDLGEYLRIIEQRQSDFIKLLEHCEELSQKLLEQKQESELANFIIEKQSSEDRLKEQLVNLRLENSELKRELEKLSKPTQQPQQQKSKLPDNEAATIATKSTQQQLPPQQKPIKKFSLEEDIEDLLATGEEDPFDSALNNFLQ